MSHFIEGLDRQQTMLLAEHLDDYVDENNAVRAIDAFADLLDLAALGFNAQAAATGRPGDHPGLMLWIYTGISLKFSHRVVWNGSASVIWTSFG